MSSFTDDLPKNWALTTIGDIYVVLGGGTPSTEVPDYWGGNTPWITSADIENVRQINHRKYVTDKGIRESTTNQVPAKTLLVVTRVGLGKIAISDSPICFSQDLQGLMQRPELVLPEYSLYLLSYELQILKFEGRGTTISGITKKQLKDLSFPLPPINEQHRIVAKIEELFSELDKGIENLKTARAQLKVYRQALLKHAFEGKLTAQWRAENQDKLETAEALQKRIQLERTQRYQQQLADWEAVGKRGSKPKAPKPLPPLTAEELTELPELPEGWGWFKVVHICDVVRGGSPRPAGDPKFYGGNIPFLKVADVTNTSTPYLSSFTFTITEAGLSKTRQIEPNTLLLSNSGATLGVPKICLISATMNDGVAAFLGLPHEALLYHYYFWQSKTEYLRNINQGAAQPNLNTELIKETFIPVCSLAEELVVTQKLEAALSEVDQLDQTITSSLQQAEALRQSILKKAFSGQLVAQDTNDEPAAVLLARIKTERDAQTIVTKQPKPQKIKEKPVPAKTNVIPFPVKIGNISTTDLHAGILARAYQHHEKDSKYLAYFGHVKAEKIAHMVEAHLGIDLGREPIKDAAGPNDYPHLKKVESRAQKANWFDVRKKKDGAAYVLNKKQGFETLLGKTGQALGDRAASVDDLIHTLLPLNTKQAEIVATLYAAWNNLLLLGRSPNDEDVVYEARENWHPSKLEIERDKFFKELGWMRNQGLVPVGKGRYVNVKDKSKTGKDKA